MNAAPDSTEAKCVLVGVLLSLNIRLDYLKNVHPFSTASYFGYSCIGSQFAPIAASVE